MCQYGTSQLSVFEMWASFVLKVNQRYISTVHITNSYKLASNSYQNFIAGAKS